MLSLNVSLASTTIRSNPYLASKVPHDLAPAHLTSHRLPFYIPHSTHKELLIFQTHPILSLTNVCAAGFYNPVDDNIAKSLVKMKILRSDYKPTNSKSPEKVSRNLRV